MKHYTKPLKGINFVIFGIGFHLNIAKSFLWGAESQSETRLFYIGWKRKSPNFVFTVVVLPLLLVIIKEN